MSLDLLEWSEQLLADTAPLLRTQRLGRAARALGGTTSTMLDAAEWLAAGAPDGALVVAATQSIGRGRLGRAWHDHAGASLLCSVVLRPGLPAGLTGLIPLAAGVAGAMAIERATGLAPALKWPNDIVVLGESGDSAVHRLSDWESHHSSPSIPSSNSIPRPLSTLSPAKLAGVLAEARAGAVVVGMGMNVGRDAVPDDPAVAATSLEAECEGPVAPAPVLAAYLDALEDLLDSLAVDAGARVRNEWEARMHARGEAVTAGGVAGIALGIAPDGALRLTTDAGESLVYAGDVAPANAPVGAG